MYHSKEVNGDQHVDFEHRPRDDNDPVFTQPSDWTTESSYLLEVECNTADDYDIVHHLVMANVRANWPLDHDLADDEGYIEYFYEEKCLQIVQAAWQCCAIGCGSRWGPMYTSILQRTQS